MDNGWNRIGEDKTAKNECLRKERYVFVFEDGEKKENNVSRWKICLCKKVSLWT